MYPNATDDARWIFEKTPRIIAFYGELFDYPYPWAKYDQVTTPNVGGGAEATSATILGDGVIHDRRAEQDFSWEQLIAHEIAHQWWGNLITSREWSHTWLNESFGTYSAEPLAADLLRKLALDDPFLAVRIAALEVLGTAHDLILNTVLFLMFG